MPCRCIRLGMLSTTSFDAGHCDQSESDSSRNTTIDPRTCSKLKLPTSPEARSVLTGCYPCASSQAGFVPTSMGCRYLLQQGYVGEGEVTILTPYVGQLMKLKQAFEAVAGLRFVMSDRDQLDLENALADAAVESENIDGATSSIRWARADGASILGCGSGSTSSSGGSSVVTLGQAIRLATIDNFQVCIFIYCKWLCRIFSLSVLILCHLHSE